MAVPDRLRLTSRRLAWAGLFCLATGALSFLFVDRWAALFAHQLGRPTHQVFAFITQFGQSTGYLVISGVAFLVLFGLDRRWRRYAWSAAFLFLNVGLSGLAVDVVKVILGRARPKLLFSEGLYGFTWFGNGPDRWSFPSGHVATAVALALSLTLIWRRWWPAWWLCALLIVASRVIIGAHYPSDLIGALYVALLTYWGVSLLFARYRLPIALDKPDPALSR